MSGIAGEVPLSTNACAESGRAVHMLEAILHKVPAGSDWEDPTHRAALWNCRLAIVDVGHSHQPMRSTRGDITIAFKGEIYGSEQLRQRLSAWGYKFCTADRML